MGYDLARMRIGALLAAITCLGFQATAPAEQSESTPLPLNVFKHLVAGQKQTVVVYGTSVTIHGEWAKSLQAYFEDKFPGQVTFANAAMAGMDSNWGLRNISKRVLSKNPDLVFIEFAINDAATKNKVSLEKAEANLDAMVQAIRQQNPVADIVLQTMDQAWDSPTNKKKKYGSDRPELAAYYDVYRRYAHEHQLPLVDNYPIWLKLQHDNPAEYEKMVPDGIHPNSASSVAVAWPAIESLMEKARTAATSTKTTGQ
ncbi:MAG: SGNH/GDSL hydrolase family protein [Tepidisphaeraceae bacterium]